MSLSVQRFPIRFERWYEALSTALFISPSDSYVEFDDAEVVVRMAWAFRGRFARSAIRSAAVLGDTTIRRGVHGMLGRWLVNGSGDGILTIRLEPAQRAYVLGFPIRVRQLKVSVDDPGAVARVFS